MRQWVANMCCEVHAQRCAAKLDGVLVLNGIRDACAELKLLLNTPDYFQHPLQEHFPAKLVRLDIAAKKADKVHIAAR